MKTALAKLETQSPCCSLDICSSIQMTVHQLAESLGRAIDAKDAFTSSHSDQVAVVSQLIAYAAGLPPSLADMVHIAGHLHDIGKIGIPDAILRKEGALTDEEWALIRQHPVIGAQILTPVKALNGRLGIVDMVLQHHERFDGSGYPYGLKGRDICPGARIIAVADSLSAMVQDRTYRRRMPFEDAVEEIRRGSGTLYDPQVVQAFLKVRKDVRNWLENME